MPDLCRLHSLTGPFLAINWTEYLGGASAAPWIWWFVALALLVGVLLLLLKVLGLFPE